MVLRKQHCCADAFGHTPCDACSAVMLVGTKNGNISVGEVESDYKEEVPMQIHRLLIAECMLIIILWA